MIERNSEQEAALTLLRSFALRAIKETDDRCLCQLDANNRLND